VKILIAEDDDCIRDLLRLQTAASLHAFDFASDGAEALRMYGGALMECRPYHLLVLDCSMPRMSGIETLSRIRELGDEGTRVVFLTAYAAEITPEDARELCISEVWEKPSALLDLERRVSEMLIG
jgi:CheY-like chemotaxis protein